jgi:glycerol-3-phosphate dehydrogenase (NAD(P)+)
MTSKNIYDQAEAPVGVIGSGSFGTAVANLLSKNRKVILFARKPEVVDQINSKHHHYGVDLPSNIVATHELEHIAEHCNILFPVVPSSNFRRMMKDLAPFLHPYHILIHGTKGLDLSLPEGHSLDDNISFTRSNIKTMSEVIAEESISVRVGCLAGPNLAKEILENQPAATVIASHFDEVIDIGQRLLRTDRFQVYGNNDLIGIELAGVLKNIIAIAAGALSGLGYGENARSLLISRGMIEIIHLGRILGGNTKTFIGLAGVGDLIATCTSPLSRNYTVGFRRAKGETLQEITSNLEETAEGVNTVRVIKKILENSGKRAPITEALYKILYEDLTVEGALELLMRSPFNDDISFE